MLGIIVEKIKHLSQDEGLKDCEIADIIKCSRNTIFKVRKLNDIPTANLRNRKDKVYFCSLCNKKVTIRRRERKRQLCKSCQSKINSV